VLGCATQRHHWPRGPGLRIEHPPLQRHVVLEVSFVFSPPFVVFSSNPSNHSHMQSSMALRGALLVQVLALVATVCATSAVYHRIAIDDVQSIDLAIGQSITTTFSKTPVLFTVWSPTNQPTNQPTTLTPSLPLHRLTHHTPTACMDAWLLVDHPQRHRTICSDIHQPR
jgi:hypothetical protein